MSYQKVAWWAGSAALREGLRCSGYACLEDIVPRDVTTRPRAAVARVLERFAVLEPGTDPYLLQARVGTHLSQGDDLFTKIFNAA
jgi:hypothetical protein